jgi:hypothetical protein
MTDTTTFNFDYNIINDASSYVVLDDNSNVSGLPRTYNLMNGCTWTNNQWLVINEYNGSSTTTFDINSGATFINNDELDLRDCTFTNNGTLTAVSPSVMHANVPGTVNVITNNGTFTSTDSNINIATTSSFSQDGTLTLAGTTQLNMSGSSTFTNNTTNFTDASTTYIFVHESAVLTLNADTIIVGG